MGNKNCNVHSDVDAESMHVKLADESVCIGSQPKQLFKHFNYVCSRFNWCRSNYPGYGFLSENAKFSEIVNKHGINLLDLVQNTLQWEIKLNKAYREKFSLPVIEGSEGGVKTLDDKIYIKDIGYPVLIKAAGGGGGKGMKIVNEENQLENMFLMHQRQVLLIMMNCTQKNMKNPRHIEVQIMSEKINVHLANCSVQKTSKIN